MNLSNILVLLLGFCVDSTVCRQDVDLQQQHQEEHVLSLSSLSTISSSRFQWESQQQQRRELSWADRTGTAYISESADSLHSSKNRKDDDGGGGDDDDDDDSLVSSKKARGSDTAESSNATIKASAEASYAYMHEKQTSANETVHLPWNYTVDMASLNSTTTLLPKEPDQFHFWPLYVSVGFGALAVAFGFGACIQLYGHKKRRHYQDIPTDLIV